MANIVHCQLWGWTFGSLPAGKFPRHEARRVYQWDRHRHHRQYAQDFETSTVSQSRALKHPLANCGNQWKQHQGANLTGTGVPGFMGVTFPDTIYIYIYHISMGPELFSPCFSRFGLFFASSVLSVFLVICRIWSWKLPFQRYCNILEFEPLIFLFMLDGILRLGSI